MIFGVMLLIGLASAAIGVFVIVSAFFTDPLVAVSMFTVISTLCYWRYRHNVRKDAPIRAENERRMAAMTEEWRIRDEELQASLEMIRNAPPGSITGSTLPPYSPEPWDLNPPKPQPEINEWLW